MSEEQDDGAGRRLQAIAAFNHAWDLIVLPERTQREDDEMLASAFASRYLWETIGGDEQRAVGDWQIARRGFPARRCRPRARTGDERPRAGATEPLDRLAARLLLRGDGTRARGRRQWG